MTEVTLQRHDGGAGLGPLIEIDGGGVHHTYAAARGIRLVGAVNAKQRVPVALEQIKRAGAVSRIPRRRRIYLGAALHALASARQRLKLGAKRSTRKESGRDQ